MKPVNCWINPNSNYTDDLTCNLSGSNNSVSEHHARPVTACLLSSQTHSDICEDNNAGKQYGCNRQFSQTPWICLSIQRNLRRNRFDLGLRSSWRRTEEQRQTRMVALCCIRARRHGRPGCRDYYEPG